MKTCNYKAFASNSNFINRGYLKLEGFTISFTIKKKNDFKFKEFKYLLPFYVKLTKRGFIEVQQA